MEPRWFHITTHTYAAWLHGDPRGFRTRHHRLHVEGDYKNPPPPGMYRSLHQRSLELLKQPPVKVDRDLREVVAFAMVEKLNEYGALVLVLNVGSTHAHFLARMPPGPVPKLWTGYAKREATFRPKALGWRGKLWAKGGKVIPVKDRQHQLNTVKYITDHRDEGAWVWDFRNYPATPRGRSSAGFPPA